MLPGLCEGEKKNKRIFYTIGIERKEDFDLHLIRLLDLLVPSFDISHVLCGSVTSVGLLQQSCAIFPL